MTEVSEVRAFAPATVGNVLCGFDVLGMALDSPGDEVVARRVDTPGVRLVAIHGDREGKLPRDTDRNTASVAAAAVLRRAGMAAGLELELHKGLPFASGMGGSAASAVAGALAADAALVTRLDRTELLACALEGELAAAGAAHADNAAPALYGGLTLALPGDPIRVVQLPVPRGLSVALVHPPLEMETAKSREAIGDTVPLSAAITQWASTAALVAGLYEEDWELVSRALVDHIAEPVRKRGLPGFEAARAAALQAGALGAGLSGSGPSIFALCRSIEQALAAGEAIADALETAGVESATVHVGPVGRSGARIVEATSQWA
jgi:homoserine kinase